MPGPGHFPQGVGDGGGRAVRELEHVVPDTKTMSASGGIMSHANWLPLPAQRLHQMEIKRKLEEFARRERVHKMKVSHLHVNGRFVSPR